MNATLTKDTKVTIGLGILIAAAIVAVGGAWNHMLNRLEGMSWELRGINEKLESLRMLGEDHVLQADFKAWLREFRALNPDVNVPEPPS